MDGKNYTYAQYFDNMVKWDAPDGKGSTYREGFRRMAAGENIRTLELCRIGSTDGNVKTR